MPSWLTSQTLHSVEFPPKHQTAVPRILTALYWRYPGSKLGSTSQLDELYHLITAGRRPSTFWSIFPCWPKPPTLTKLLTMLPSQPARHIKTVGRKCLKTCSPTLGALISEHFCGLDTHSKFRIQARIAVRPRICQWQHSNQPCLTRRGLSFKPLNAWNKQLLVEISKIT